MIWLNHQGGIQPVGSRIATAVSIGGATWDVWFGNVGWNVISYVRTTGTTSVNNLNIVSFTNEAVSRGFIQTGWFLITVEAGFEPWQGGSGLATNSFSVTIGGGVNPTATRTPTGPTSTPTRTPTRTPTTGPTSTPTRTPTGPTNTPTRTPTTGPTNTPTTGASCQVTYTIVNQWTPGFQASVDIKNTGSTPISGWTLAWTFANGQTIGQLWGATFTQTGANISATNLDWNATIAPNALVNVGFNGTWNGTNAKPTSFRLNGAACSVTP
jgi:cellulose 1,4-beta-cellobiosidase